MGEIMEEDLFLRSLLLREVIPATGCTEVGAVALAAGWAARALSSQGDNLEEIEIEVDESTYKNGFGVGVPGTGESGLVFAAAMGALSPSKVEQGLQILENPESATIDKARTLIADHRVKVIRVSGPRDILIRAKVRYKDDDASALIQGSHDHLVGVEKNRKPYHGAPASGDNFWKQVEQIKNLKYPTIIEFVQRMDLKEFPVLRQAMEMNMRFAMEALEETPSLKIGKVMDKHGNPGEMGEGLSGRIQFITALAVEARMKGLDLPVMACAGSGNQGLVATIPVVEKARRLGTPEEQVLRALALSYLTTIYIKAYTGLLSPICGCGVAAAVGAGCGIVLLMGGNASQIEAQVNNMIGAMAGIICDGAKSGCSLKALMAVGLAVDSSYLSMKNVQISAKDGIMGKDVMDTLRNLQEIIEGGMASMDATIVKVMETKS
jgi:L-cysteine desulfidase